MDTATAPRMAPMESPEERRARQKRESARRYRASHLEKERERSREAGRQRRQLERQSRPPKQRARLRAVAAPNSPRDFNPELEQRINLATAAKLALYGRLADGERTNAELFASAFDRLAAERGIA